MTRTKSNTRNDTETLTTSSSFKIVNMHKQIDLHKPQSFFKNSKIETRSEISMFWERSLAVPVELPIDCSQAI